MNIKINNAFTTKIEVVKSLGEDLKAKRQEILLYRVFFLSLGCTFVYLAAHIFCKSGILALPITLMQWAAPFKGLVSLFSSLFGVASLWIGCCLRSERELLLDRYKRKKKQLKRVGDLKGIDCLDSIAIKGERALDQAVKPKQRFLILQSTVSLIDRI